MFEMGSSAVPAFVDRDPLATFRLELHGLSNGFIIQLAGAHGAGIPARSFVVQLGGNTEEDFEEVIDAIRQSYFAHRQALLGDS